MDEETEIGCDYCRNDGKLDEDGVCPKCDAQWFENEEPKPAPKLSKNQRAALNAAASNGGELILIMSNCWSTPDGEGGSWASVMINALIKLGLMQAAGEFTRKLTDAGYAITSKRIG
jgi:hypothetical protein